MLERVEVLEGGRKELRRGVGLVCEVASEVWGEEIPFRLVDLSPSGAFVESPLPLIKGDEVEIRFKPPRSRALYLLRARVVRSSLGRRCPDTDVPGMGLEFLDLSAADRRALAGYLVGIPPRVPGTTKGSKIRVNAAMRSVGTEMVWVDEVLLDESAGADAPEVSEVILPELDGLEPVALAPLLSVGLGA